MLTPLREIAVPDRPCLLQACDLVLRPLHCILETPRIVQTREGRWIEVAPSKDLLIVTIAFVASVVLSPAILVAALIKVNSQKMRDISKCYYFAHLESYFLRQKYRIMEANRSVENCFSFTLQKANELQITLHFDCWGNLSLE